MFWLANSILYIHCNKNHKKFEYYDFKGSQWVKNKLL